MFDRYGFRSSFTHKDLMEGLGIDLESVEEIIQILSSDLQIISKLSSESESTLPEWKLNSFEGIEKHDYI